MRKITLRPGREPVVTLVKANDGEADRTLADIVWAEGNQAVIVVRRDGTKVEYQREED